MDPKEDKSKRIYPLLFLIASGGGGDDDTELGVLYQETAAEYFFELITARAVRQDKLSHLSSSSDELRLLKSAQELERLALIPKKQDEAYWKPLRADQYYYLSRFSLLAQMCTYDFARNSLYRDQLNRDLAYYLHRGDFITAIRAAIYMATFPESGQTGENTERSAFDYLMNQISLIEDITVQWEITLLRAGLQNVHS